MNILFFSQAAWDNKNSVGNTFSNLFEGDIWSNDMFFHMFARKKVPDNRIKAYYYHISAADIVRGLLKNQNKAQESFEEGGHKQASVENADQKEQRHIDNLHKGNHEFLYYLHEAVWRSRLWRDKQFDRFIKKASPDILFAFATSPYILWPLIQYLKKHTTCKVVLLVADDVYGSYDRCAFYRRGYLRRELENCILAADKLYGISDEMSELYANRFGRPVATLYKGCDLTMEPKQYLNQPLRFVYAGNLLWGRADTLAQVAEALERINQDGQKAVLEVYTGTTVTEELRKRLEKDSTSRIMGSRPYEEIKRILHEADVVLHVESFEKSQQETVRYSFSTKIIDCLQSGAQVLGIGPAGIASIEYLKKVDGAAVIDRQEGVMEAVEDLIRQGTMPENAKRTRQYALQQHERNAVQEKLRNDFETLLSEMPLSPAQEG